MTGSIMRTHLTAALLLILTATPTCAAEDPQVSARPASSVGQTVLTVNGSIQPHGLPTTYYFEYGPTDSYGAKTPTVALPPRLASYYHEN